MFTFSDSDIVSLDNFSLSWRWRSEKHNRLSDADLAKIHPFTPDKAGAAYKYSENFQGKNYREKFEEIDEYPVEVRGDNPEGENVRDWLIGLLGKKPLPIFISWSKNWAVATDSDTFIRFWDDFLYPVEDVVIWPVDESWVLLWDYKQRFYFARQKEITR